MTKADFIASVYKKTDLGSKAKAEEAVNAVLSAITEALTTGEGLTLTGFGAFKVAERAARTGRNPRTGQEITIPATKAIKFTAGKGLKDALK